jgi:hypothetical protein
MMEGLAQIDENSGELPTVYFLRGFVADGGLISYGSDTIDLHRRAASYVDRILMIGPSGPVSPDGRLRRPYPEGREAS